MLEVTNSIEFMESIFEEWLLQNYSLGELEETKVFLKPNIGYPKPSPYTTNLDLIKSIVKVLDKHNVSEIIIGEGSTSNKTALENFTTIGLQKKLIEYQVTYIDLNSMQPVKVKLKNKSIHYLPSFLKDVELKISIPVIKFYDDDQGETFLSNAIKNFFGLPPKKYYQTNDESNKRDGLHKDLHKSVEEIFLSIEQYAPFDLYICDGLKILHGEAEHGEPMNWGKIIFATNAIQADLKVLKLLDKPLPRYLRSLTKGILEG